MNRPGVKRLFRFPWRTREDIRTDVADEFQYHIETRTEELVRRGMSAREASDQALREFGDLGGATRASVQREERVERRRSLRRLAEEFRQDVLLGMRLIIRNPGFALTAIATLAVTIAGHTAIFSVTNSLLFKPLPATAPEELARVRGGSSQMSWLDYQDLVERQQVFRDLVAHRRLVASLAAAGTAARASGEQTSPNYFRILGVAPVIGRTFLPSDVRRDLIVLADHVWRTRFGGEASVIGRVTTLNDRPYEIIGVMPPRFRGVAPAGLRQDFWIPVNEPGSDRLLSDRTAARFEVFGRLNSNVTHEQAATELRVAADQIRVEHPQIRDAFTNMEVFPVQGLGAFRGMADLILPVIAFLALMTLVAGLVLLIGCANISGLLLGRAAARRKEIAVRLALGAGRGRLIRQLLTESLVLAVVGGTAGMLLALWLIGSVNPLLSRLPIPIEFDLRLDRRVLAYTFGLATLTAFVFGLAPARRTAAFDVASSLKDDSAGLAGRQRLRRLLVIGQVTVCTALLVWSGLFLRSFGHIATIDPGFDDNGVIVARVELDESVHDATFGLQFARNLQQSVEQSAGVTDAGIATVIPLSLDNEEFDIIRVEEEQGSQPLVQRVLANRLTPGWFETLRIPLLAGRDFRWSDADGAPEVAVVNETLARQFWNGNAVGRHVRIPGPREQVLEIVGVVRDSKYWTLGETVAPTIYLAYQQAYFRYLTLHVRAADTRAAAEAVRRAARQFAPDVFVDIGPMNATTTIALLPARVGAAASASFGLLALLLATLGVYGLVAFSVSQRIREIAIRRAIGATTYEVIRQVISEHAVLTFTGVAAGFVIGGLGGLAFRGFIAGVSPIDAVTFGTVAIFVVAAALLGSALPTLRAARVSPMLALRDS